MSTRRAGIAVLALVAAATSLAAPNASASRKGVTYGSPSVGDTPIASSGPLTNIELGDELSCQVAYQAPLASPANQVYAPWTAPGDCGTFLAVDKTLYAPHFWTHGTTATGGLGAYTPYTKISQTTQTGSGTLADPYIVTTVVDAGTTGLRITQIDTYVTGRREFRSDIVVTNNAEFTQRAILSRGVDCYFAGSDSGTGIFLPNAAAQTNSVGCVKPNTVRSERLISLSAGNTYLQDRYSNVWRAIGAKAPLPNTCTCATVHDNGIAIAWSISLPPNGSVIRSLLHQFTDSPVIIDFPVDPTVSCTLDPGAIPNDDPRPHLSCTAAPPATTVGSSASCAADAVVSSGASVGALSCATESARVTCRLSARPGSAQSAQPCDVGLQHAPHDLTSAARPRT